MIYLKEKTSLILHLLGLKIYIMCKIQLLKKYIIKIYKDYFNKYMKISKTQKLKQKLFFIKFIIMLYMINFMMLEIYYFSFVNIYIITENSEPSMDPYMEVLFNRTIA